MAETSIEWTDKVWNPIRGCWEISPGCVNCYAAKDAYRFAGPGLPYEGLVEKRPNGKITWNGPIRLVPEKLVEPLSWRKPAKIFVNSMSDLFHQDVPNEFIAAVFSVMACCPQHTFQVLTKRPERMVEWFDWVQSRPATRLGGGDPEELLAECAVYHGSDVLRKSRAQLPKPTPWPLPNVWLGASVEDQQRADERIPHLLRVPAAVRFLSMEPLLSAVDLKRYLPRRDDDNAAFLMAAGHDPIHWGMRSPSNPGIDWCIVGGESGPKARPMHPAWARSIRDQCVAAGVPFFFKQWGEWAGWRQLPEGWSRTNEASHGWGEGGVGYRVGKKAAGRLLDGRTWDELPAPVKAATS